VTFKRRQQCKPMANVTKGHF